MISTLTLPYLTCIDHAYVDDEGRIRGRSYHASFIVSGKVDEEGEKVVVDFSKIKKLIKATVDDHYHGFDHKLWVDPSFDYQQTDYSVKTPFAELHLPANAIRTFPAHSHLNQVDASLVIADHVQSVLLNVHGLDVTIKCSLKLKPLFIQAGGVYGMFSYVHGLRDSSAYGCQNMAHGHLSYLQLITKADSIRLVSDPVHWGSNSLDAPIEIVCSEICNDLDDTVFIYGDNVDRASEDSVDISYESKARGVMTGFFKNTEHQKVVILETETTVEYLAEYINAKYGAVLREAGVDRFIVSEGLSKGVLFEITS